MCVGVRECVFCDFWVREQKRNMWLFARRGECFDIIHIIVGFMPKECVKNMFKGMDMCFLIEREVGSTFPWHRGKLLTSEVTSYRS